MKRLFVFVGLLSIFNAVAKGDSSASGNPSSSENPSGNVTPELDAAATVCNAGVKGGQGLLAKANVSLNGAPQFAAIAFTETPERNPIVPFGSTSNPFGNTLTDIHFELASLAYNGSYFVDVCIDVSPSEMVTLNTSQTLATFSSYVQAANPALSVLVVCGTQLGYNSMGEIVASNNSFRSPTGPQTTTPAASSILTQNQTFSFSGNLERCIVRFETIENSNNARLRGITESLSWTIHTILTPENN